ncbi:MAG: DUF169 domain-containing protein [Methanobrevibacter sp.]|jgi:uncharacterized protein (DUF169 family)|nr:DUF169 domain-containing protein [Candidatus Methanovirga procula]
MNFKELNNKFKELLELEKTPVAIKWDVKEPNNINKEDRKTTFCKKLQKALNGEIFYSSSEEQLCMGGSIFTGIQNQNEFSREMLSLEFLVNMGAYDSVYAAQRSWDKNKNIKPGIFKTISFGPLDKVDFKPDVIFVVCNADQGMEILHANSYDSGEKSIGADSGPICSSMVATPYVTGKLTYGFGEAGARGNMSINPTEIMISIPSNDLHRVVSNLEKMKAGVFLK